MSLGLTLATSDRGEWETLAISPPFEELAGDTYRTTGNQIQQIRGGAVIAFRTLDLSMASPVIALPATGAGQRSEMYFFKERHVMAVATCTDVQQAESGIVTFKFSNGDTREVEDHAAGRAKADSMDANMALAQDVIISKAYRHSPDGTDLAAVIGSSVTIDTAASHPFMDNFADRLN